MYLRFQWFGFGFGFGFRAFVYMFYRNEIQFLSFGLDKSRSGINLDFMIQCFEKGCGFDLEVRMEGSSTVLGRVLLGPRG